MDTSTTIDEGPMTLDEKLLAEARLTRDRLIKAQYEADRIELAVQHLIRRLHAAGGSLREIADALVMSHQRVHQIVDVTAGKGALKQKAGKTKGKTKGEPLTCSFCGSTQGEVRKLIAGPGVYICDGCLEVANKVLADSAAHAPAKVALKVASGAAACGFCGKKRRQVESIVAGPGVHICNECIALCNEITAEELGDGR